jgi:hypothetical protein
VKRTVDAVAAGREPHLIWNAFIDLIAAENYDDLSPLQRKAHLAFWYDSEVQNGGHGQYFENQGRQRLRETVAALHDLGLSCQARVLERAADRLAAADSQGEWNDILPDGFVEELDDAFHACRPDVTTALGQHLRVNESQYVDIA